jgi:hypothetical protein
MSYPHKIQVKEIPVPPKTIQVTIETDLGPQTTKKQFFASREEFLQFWEPLVNYYGVVKNDEDASEK